VPEREAPIRQRVAVATSGASRAGCEAHAPPTRRGAEPDLLGDRGAMHHIQGRGAQASSSRMMLGEPGDRISRAWSATGSAGDSPKTCAISSSRAPSDESRISIAPPPLIARRHGGGYRHERQAVGTACWFPSFEHARGACSSGAQRRTRGRASSEAWLEIICPSSLNSYMPCREARHRPNRRRATAAIAEFGGHHPHQPSP